MLESLCASQTSGPHLTRNDTTRAGLGAEDTSGHCGSLSMDKKDLCHQMTLLITHDTVGLNPATRLLHDAPALGTNLAHLKCCSECRDKI